MFAPEVAVLGERLQPPPERAAHRALVPAQRWGGDRMTTFVTSFSPWLLRQAERDDPVGALAREARRDPAWPTRTDALPRLDRYLHHREATVATRRALRRAYGEWLIATADEVR